MNAPEHKSLPRRLLKIAALLLVLLTAAGAVTAWLMREKIADIVLDIAEARLAENGLHIRRGSHEFSIRRGVILKQLELFSDLEKQDRLARLGNLGIRIPWREISRSNATIYFSANDSGLTLETSAGQLQVNDVNFSMTFTSGSLAIDHLDSRLRNLRVTAAGLLRWQSDGTAKSLAIPDLSPLAKAAAWLDFPQGTPTLALDFATSPQGGVDLKGHLTGSSFVWRKMAFSRADVRAELTSGTVEIPSLDVDCHGGNLTAALTLDHAAGLLKVGKLTSSVEPFRFVEAVMGRHALKSCRTLGTTTLSGSNLVFNFREFSRSSGVLKVDSPAGLAIDIGRMEIEMADFHGSLRFADRKLTVDGEKFAICGGTGGGTYSMPLQGKYSYQLKVMGTEMSMEQIGRKFGTNGPLAGQMSATFEGGGASGMTSQSGNGRISVKGGKFYSIPLFGSLKALLTQQSAKFGVDEARDLTCTYALKDGIVRSDDLRITSTATQLHAKGQVDMVRKTLDADARANLRGIAGLATGIPSLIFELHGEGPLDDVRWEFANLPGIVSGAAEVTLDGVKAVTGGVGKVIEGVGGTTRKLFGERPGLLIPKPRTKTGK